MDCRDPRLANSAEECLDQNDGSSRRLVLFVSENKNLRDAAGRMLEREGYDAVTAAHAGHAVLAALTHPRIDFLVCEASAGDMPGHALARALRRHHPRVHTLYMADDDAPLREGVVVRPFTADDLLLKLEAAGSPPTSSAS